MSETNIIDETIRAPIFMSETISKLAAALSKAQGVLDHAKKDVANSFYNSKYATLASVLDVGKLPLSDNGLAVAQTTDFDGEGNITLTTTLLHSSGEWIMSRYPVDPVKRDPQGYGSALSYARRYSVSAIIGIASADDDGEGAMGRGKQHSQDVIPPKKGSLAPLPESKYQKPAAVPLPTPDAGKAPIITSWKDIRVHLGKKGGNVNGRKLGDLQNLAVNWLRETLTKVANPTKEDSLLIAALAMRDAELYPKSPQPELGSSKPNLEALRAKLVAENIPLAVMTKVSNQAGGEALAFDGIPEDEAGHFVANWKDTLQACKDESDQVPM